MRLLTMLALCCAPLLLSGCGVAKEVKDTATAPVDNIQKNVQYMQDTKKELNDMSKKRNDQANEAMDSVLNKK